MNVNAKSGGSVVKLVIRIVLVLVLLVAVIALGLDVLCRSQSSAAYQKLQDLWNTPQTEAVTPEVVEKMVGRAPDSDEIPAEGSFVQVYTWRGLARSYKVYVAYRYDVAFEDGESKLVHHLENISLNEPLGGGGGEMEPNGGDPAVQGTGQP